MYVSRFHPLLLRSYLLCMHTKIMISKFLYVLPSCLFLPHILRQRHQSLFLLLHSLSFFLLLFFSLFLSSPHHFIHPSISQGVEWFRSFPYSFFLMYADDNSLSTSSSTHPSISLPRSLHPSILCSDRREQQTNEWRGGGREEVESHLIEL